MEVKYANTFALDKFLGGGKLYRRRQQKNSSTQSIAGVPTNAFKQTSSKAPGLWLSGKIITDTRGRPEEGVIGFGGIGNPACCKALQTD
jgi:hypothetical protein